MVRAVVFDKDGTIIDNLCIAVRAVNATLDEGYGLPGITVQEFLETWQTPLRDFYKAHGAEISDVNRHQELFSKHWVQAVNHFGLNAHKNIEATLIGLKEKGLKLGVLSGHTTHHVRLDLAQLGLANHFDALVGEDYIARAGLTSDKKTDRLMNKLEITDPSEILYIGDIAQDAQMARGAGFFVGLYTKGWQSLRRLEAASPDYIFDDHLEILGKV